MRLVILLLSALLICSAIKINHPATELRIARHLIVSTSQ
jgi:hypothetical protein